MKLFKYQKEPIRRINDAGFILLSWRRQGGKTLTLASIALKLMANVSAEALALERQKWSYRAAETLLDAIADRMSRAQEIASSSASRSDKIAQLVNEFLDR
jgi:hypothetical protein